MRNVSGYLTDDGKFFTDKKEAENHERLTNINKEIEHLDKCQKIIELFANAFEKGRLFSFGEQIKVKS